VKKLVSSFREGELVYLPASSVLVRYDKNNNVEDYKKLKEPRNLLVVDTGKEVVGLHFLGKVWYTKASDIYRTEK